MGARVFSAISFSFFLCSFLFKFSMGHVFPRIVSQMKIMMFSVHSFSAQFKHTCARICYCVWFVVRHLQVVSETEKIHTNIQTEQPYDLSWVELQSHKENSYILICRSWIKYSIKITRSYIVASAQLSFSLAAVAVVDAVVVVDKL